MFGLRISLSPSAPKKSVVRYSPVYVPWCGLAVVEELSGIRTDAVDPYQYVASWPGQQLKPAEAEVLNRASELLSRIPAR